MNQKNAAVTGSPIISVLLHVPDWRAATEWYAKVFDTAIRIQPAPDDYGHLDIGGIALEIDRICQMRDPWGNCIGLRQPFAGKQISSD